MEKLYYKGSNFNQVRIIKELVNIIKENGGSIVNSYFTEAEKAIYYNRSIQEERIEKQSQLGILELAESKKELNEAQKEYRNKLKKQLEELEEVEKTQGETVSYYDNYITFYYKDFIYYIQLNDNPFFDNLFNKNTVEAKEDNCYITNVKRYGESLSYDLYDEIMKINIYSYLQDEEIQEAAKRLFNYLIKKSAGEPVTERKRVYNTYNSGFHYENITEKQKTIYKNVVEVE